MQKTVDELLQSAFIHDIKGNAILAFNGVISQDAIVGLGDVLRSELHLTYPLSVVNKIFAIYIEMTQNILHYSSEQVDCNGKSFGKGAVFVFEIMGGYELVTVNVISEKQHRYLEKKCNLINSLNKEDIKEFYLKRRRKIAETESKGAGLGFIDIVRRSGNQVIFDFEPVDNDKFLFYLRSKILTE
ncbi:MAG: SiaB family protein kinase [Bacteroidales bacterium]|nr:SiaB family protein kinase [Bacteroidales bacterium]